MGQNVFTFKTGWDSLIQDCEYKNPNVSLDNLAYIVYSSGTTGKPKGTIKTEIKCLNIILFYFEICLRYNVPA